MLLKNTLAQTKSKSVTLNKVSFLMLALLIII